MSLLTLGGPVVGEVIATLPPRFPSTPINPLTEAGLVYDEVTFLTEDRLTLRGWFIPAQRTEAPAVVYAPATGQDQRSGLSLASVFHRAGYHVLLFSYRGHGLSEGRRGGFTYGDAESKDVDAAVRFLFQTKEIKRVGVIGHSAGAVSAILSAARNPQVGAVVAVAPFNCVDEVWQTSRPALVPRFVLNWALWVAEKSRGFSREEVCPLRVVERISPRPLLVIHGTDDSRITEDQVHRLFAAAQSPKTLWLVRGATHSSIRSPSLDRLAPDVIAFLNTALRAREASTAQIAPGAVEHVVPW
jgi:dipeptidyl aminopeptidase/acylaminoacyl peptidase